MPAQQIKQSRAKLHPQPPAPFSNNIISEWALDPDIAFLNHGSFGARPREVLKAQWARRMEFEARPIEWLNRRRHELIDQAKLAVSPLLGMNPRNMGFVTNATGGINAVLRSLGSSFQAGDELVTTNHVYNAVRKAMQYIARQTASAYIEVNVPLPVTSDGPVVKAIEQAITKRTRLVVVDHISSPTAVIFPVKSIVEMCATRGVDVLVDGAHAPGMVELNIEDLGAVGAAYYSANLHKWMCAPPGAAFLWVRPDKQNEIHPTTISHFLDESFVSEFNWQGTRDITPWLCVQDSIAYLETYGLKRVMKHNHQMAVWVQDMLCEKWDVEPGSLSDGSMLGSMTTVELPAQERIKRKYKDCAELMAVLYERYRIEAPVLDWGGRWRVRPCCQIYNVAEHYERLANAVLEMIQ